jgi:hypothetical protein
VHAHAHDVHAHAHGVHAHAHDVHAHAHAHVTCNMYVHVHVAQGGP